MVDYVDCPPRTSSPSIRSNVAMKAKAMANNTAANQGSPGVERKKRLVMVSYGFAMDIIILNKYQQIRQYKPQLTNQPGYI